SRRCCRCGRIRSFERSRRRAGSPHAVHVDLERRADERERVVFVAAPIRVRQHDRGQQQVVRARFAEPRHVVERVAGGGGGRAGVPGVRTQHRPLVNGVAGSYSEHVPVICISGSIPLRSIDRGLGMHHTMADGTWDQFLGAYAQATAAQARLTPRNAVTEIDRLILTAWREKLPVYMELPSDIAYLDIEVPSGPLTL